MHEIRELLIPEFEILDAVTDGAALIAAVRDQKPDLVISDIRMRTAESHKYEIMQTLGVQTIAELVQCAIRLKLVGE